MTFTSLHTYKCVDGRTAMIVSPIIKVAGRKECIVQYVTYPHIAVIDNDHSARIFNLDNKKDVNVMTDEEYRIETEHQEGHRRGEGMSEYYHRFARFVAEPRKGETLREFVERECFHRAEMVEQMIEELPEGKEYLLDIDTALYGAMPVNFYVYTSNYSVKKHGFYAPPIVADRMGGKTASDEEYSYFGTFDGFLHHIAGPNYPWIGELEYPDWEICPPDLITYNNYDYSGGDLDDDEEEEE